MSLATAVAERARRWAFQRLGQDRLPLRLDRRRVYILPTPLGLLYALTTFTMLLGAMNYGNSLGYALAFLLASLGVVAMQHCHRNLAGLVVRGVRAEPAFAGQSVEFRITVENPSAGARLRIAVEHDGAVADCVDLEPATRGTLRLRVVSRKRGWLHIERFALATTFPFALFRAWSWLHAPLACIVYPRPAPPGLAPPLQHTDTGGAQDGAAGDEDFAGLRTFRAGDSPRHIAWKAFAREQGPLVKQYAGTAVATHWLDWAALEGLPTEQRLQQLTRWVLDAHRDGHAYGLRVPGFAITPNLGTPHRERCLAALALFEPGRR